MAIGGLAGLTLAGLAGGPQGFQQAQQQRDQEATNLLLNRIRTKAIADAQREDQARSLLFSSLASPDQSGIAGLSALGGIPATQSPPGFGVPPAPPSGGAVSTSMGVGNASGATGQPTSLLPPGSIPSSGPLTAQQADMVLPIIKQDESGNRNIMQTAYSGAPGAINPSTGTHTAPSTASGYEQFTDTTWRAQAPKAGVDINKYPTAKSAPEEVQDRVARNDLMTQGVGDWAPWNKRLAAHLGLSSSDPVAKQAVDQATSTAQTTASTIPQMAWGRMSLTALAQQIDKADPGADPVVKMMALEQANKLLAPSEQAMWQAYMTQNSQAFQQAMQDRREAFELKLFGAKQDQGGSLVTADDGTVYRVPPSGKATPVEGLPAGGVHKVGTATQGEAKPDPAAVDQIKEYVKAGLSPPYFMRAGKQGQANMNAAMAALNKEGFKGGDVALAQGDVKAIESSYRQLQSQYDKIKAYEGLAKKNINAAIEKSANVAPTDFGPAINKYILEGEKTLGDPEVTGYNMLVMSSVNELARVLSASTGAAGLTDTARREAAEILSPYFSAGQLKEAGNVAIQEMQRRTGELESQLNTLRTRLRTGAAPGTATGAPPQRQGTESATAPQGIPVPADHASDPDGTKYQGSDGKTYVKRGGNMVPE